MSIRKQNKSLRLNVSRLKTKLDSVIQAHGVVLDEATSSDLSQIMTDEEKKPGDIFPSESFRSLFWQQQKEAVSKTGN